MNFRLRSSLEENKPDNDGQLLWLIIKLNKIDTSEISLEETPTATEQPWDDLSKYDPHECELLWFE